MQNGLRTVAKVQKVILHDKGHIAAMKSTGMKSAVRKSVDQIRRAAGPGHVAEVEEGDTRWRGTVTAVTTRARRREATDKRLTKALDAGRQ